MAFAKIFNNIKSGGSILNFFKRFNRHPSLFFATILIVIFFVCWFLYSKYYLKIDSKIIETSPIVKLDINSLNRFSENWQKRQEVLDSLSSKQYPDYFSIDGNRNINTQATTSQENQGQPTTSGTGIR